MKQNSLRNLMRIFLFATVPLMLQGCAKDVVTYTAPTAEELTLPEEFIIVSGEEVLDNLEWWKAFNSSSLNTLQEHALSSLFEKNTRQGNFDLQMAFSRLEQSVASLRKTDSSNYPSLTYRGSTGYSKSESKAESGATTYKNSNSSYSASLTLAYEVDLWGKLSAATEASRLSYQATYEDMLTSVLTISSNITNNYIDILSTRAQLKVLENQVELNSTLVETQETRFSFGQSSSLDLIQQRQQLVQSKAEKPILEEQERALLASTALLLGELPTYTVNISETALPELPPLPKTGIPAELLENRPDIRAAKMRLLASDRNLAIAKLAYFPSLSLSAGLSFSSTDLAVLLANWTASLLASVAGTIYDGGSISAEEARLNAVTEELLINYIKTVCTALNEVNEALMKEQAQVKYLENLHEQLTYQQAAEIEAQTRYLFGTDTFLRYITQLQSLQSMERTIIREQANLLKYRVTLYKSLGIRYE